MPRAKANPAARMVYYVGATMLVEGLGYRPSVVVEGERGHHPTGDDDWETNPHAKRPYFWGPTLADAQEAARMMNERQGVSAKDADLIIARSMAPRKRR